MLSVEDHRLLMRLVQAQQENLRCEGVKVTATSVMRGLILKEAERLNLGAEK